MVGHKKIALSVFSGAVAFAVVAWIVVNASLTPARKRFNEAYEKLRIGDTMSEVVALFGRRPDHTFLLRSSEIWYFRKPDDRTARVIANASSDPKRIESPRKLPDAYNHVQIAFDAQGKVFAFTWVGEDPEIHSTNGSIKGSNLGLLEESAF